MNVTALLLGLAWGASSLDLEHALPLCSWRSLSDTGSNTSSAFNVLFPDDHSVYHASLLYLKPGGAFKIRSEELAYARYLSFQTYDADVLLPTDSIQDASIVTRDGPNTYNNLTAAEAGMTQVGGAAVGGFVANPGNNRGSSPVPSTRPAEANPHLHLNLNLLCQGWLRNIRDRRRQRGPPE